MSWHDFGQQLLATVWGVILLGALGSILAVVALALLRAVWGRAKGRLFGFARSRVSKYLRRPAELRALTILFADERNYFGYILLVGELLLDVLLSALMLSASVLLLVVYLMLRGVHPSAGLAVLAGACFFSGYLFFGALAGWVFVHQEAITPGLSRVKSALDKAGPEGWSMFALDRFGPQDGAPSEKNK